MNGDDVIDAVSVREKPKSGKSDRENSKLMSDDTIISLFNKRNERAIEETSRKYGNYCMTIAQSILRSEEDAEECVNDAYLAVWNAIPPESPVSLGAFVGRIVRNLALNRLRYITAEKRGGAKGVNYDIVVDELSDAVPSDDGDIADEVALTHALDSFLTSIPPMQRMVFMRRYWYMRTEREIAKEYHITELNVRVILHRVRKKLAAHLEKEGISL